MTPGEDIQRRRARPDVACCNTRRERGVVLFIALIVLVALMLASVSLVRSVDTGNIIAGNLAFKQASVQAADFGIEVAAAALPTIITTTGVDTDLTATGGPPNYWYYATRRATDGSGAPLATAEGAGTPAAINWANVPVATTVAGNTVKVVIDRLCNAPTPSVEDIEVNCFYDGAADDGSRDINKPAIKSVPTVYYRVTARVTGPRNTLSMVQAILGR
jgi:type IV pilus assembly protein PilX